MRVSQIQNFTWAANVLVLAGVGWVGVQFWNSRKAKVPKDVVWEKQKADTSGQSRWPGELASFAHIWTTPVSGKVPLPPVVASKDPPPRDIVGEFKAKLKYLGGWEYPAQPWRSPVRLNFDGKDMTISPGSSVGGFQLRAFTFDNSDKSKPMIKLVFIHPENGTDVVITQKQSETPPLTGPANDPIARTLEIAVKLAALKKEGPLERTGVRFDDGSWLIPEEEQLWIEKFGDELIVPKLAVKPDVDADGVSHGIRILSIPEAGTPLAPTHDLSVDDVVRSINGVPVTSKEDVLNYLRGPGKGLETYTVKVDHSGTERTIVYHVPRRSGRRQD